MDPEKITLQLSVSQIKMILDALYEMDPATDESTDTIEYLEEQLNSHG